MNYKLRVKMQRHKVILIIFLYAFAPLCLYPSVSFGLDEGRWGRNPFLTGEEIRSFQKKESWPTSSTSKTTSPPVFPQWEIKSIIISGPRKVATINDHIVTVGDFLNEERILEIKEDRIVLGRDGKRRVIKQRQPFIPIKVEEER